MAQQSLSHLALEVEGLHFSRAHGMETDSNRCERLTRLLMEGAPHHPVALNLRARDALPETMLPESRGALKEVATAFAAGDFAAALDLARELGGLSMKEAGLREHTLGDLVFLTRGPAEAEPHFRAALQALGPLAPLLARLGRCALGTGDWSTARRYAVRALTENPLYGTALVLLFEAAQAEGESLLPIPIQARIFGTPGGMRVDPSLSPRGRMAWEAWLRARETSDFRERPPERSSTLRLIEVWRAGSDGQLAYSDSPNQELEALDRWERDGLLDAYLWFAGLNHENAAVFRNWRDAHRDTAERFWREGVLLP
jgi:tetratricopeptide (TPR) repeat protein